jgi:hypothetical protein
MGQLQVSSKCKVKDLRWGHSQNKGPKRR